MVTVEQVKEYLASLGISLPDFLIEALVAQMGAVEECLEQYPPSTALLIQLYLLSLLAMAQGDKYVSSQSAPSGASRSFRYQGFQNLWTSRLNLLNRLDTFNCTGELIPDDPFQANAGLWVSSGGCYE